MGDRRIAAVRGRPFSRMRPSAQDYGCRPGSFATAGMGMDSNAALRRSSGESEIPPYCDFAAQIPRATPWSDMMADFSGTASPLDFAGIQTALDVLRAEAADLWAVIGVETSGCGFLPDRRVKMLYERHLFSRFTKHRFDTK